ncbi:unnamed protein product [Protopolystoma xenopodis]|uniref:Uncharacterized protein n=1 Tax=Protopolystoma xenopodis TaxID=117903 RepID=A0A3S5ATK1_9PLAT|nr:unnamed protein product [Protopolystoma xenopodis]
MILLPPVLTHSIGGSIGASGGGIHERPWASFNDQLCIIRLQPRREHIGVHKFRVCALPVAVDYEPANKELGMESTSDARPIVEGAYRLRPGEVCGEQMSLNN